MVVARRLSGLVALAVVVSFVGGVTPAVARPAAVPVRAQVGFPVPEVLTPIDLRPVTGLSDTGKTPTQSSGRAPVWPAPGEVRVAGLVPGADAREVAGQPLRVGVERGSKPGDVTVRAESRALVERVVGVGALWTLAGEPGSTTAVTVDYSGFGSAGSAGWASRLRLSVLPACAVTTPDKPECVVATPVATTVDRSKQTLTASVSLTGGMVALAAAASTSTGPSGDFTATSLSPSSQWVSGSSDGGFAWSYPMGVPPVAGGLQPALMVTYDSNVANGRTSGTNNQPSWLGEGFDLGSSFIERKYAACSDEVGTSGANNTVKTGDLCWASDSAKSNNATWDNATLSMAGHAGELVRVGSTAVWRLKVDDGTRVEKVGTAGTAGESWKVTTTDGIQYFFGKSTVGATATNAVWKVPVAGNHSGEPGYASAFGSSFTTVPWRWNLDYVVSPNGDSMTNTYVIETNKYNKNLVTATSYDRGGYLSEVRYGERAGSESSSPAAKVAFTVAERCFNDANLSGCESATPTSTTAYHWPDVPVDAICTGATCTSTQTSPTFFTRKRLARVDTYLLQSGSYTNVDRWSVTASYPDTLDGSMTALWPASIQHKGMSGAAITLPAVTLTPAMLANRFTNLSSGSAITRARLSQVTTESGGKIVANYAGPSDCSASSLPSPETNIKACFPAFYSEGGAAPTLQWFNQYVVSSVLEQDTAQVVDQNNTVSPYGAQAKRTSYTYSGGGAWRYDDSPLTPVKYRTWNQWRGFAKVATVVGDPAVSSQPQLASEKTFFRGMNGDRLNSSGGTKSVSVTDSTGATSVDEDWLAGTVRESRTLTAATGGSEVTGQIEDPWLSAATANDGRRQAKLVGTKETRTRQTVTGGVRTTRTTIQNRSTDGLPTQTEATGDNAVTGDETCTRTTYTANNTTAWLVGKVAETSVMPALCATALDTNQVISDVRQYYDGSSTLAAAPTKGLQTRTDTLTGSVTRTWATTAQATYDQHGRPVSVTDAKNNTTNTAYTPATGSPVTAMTVTTPDPDGAGPAARQVTTTTVDPRWGKPVKLVQPAGQTTQSSVDALGRVTSVWLPGRSTSSSASVKYTYVVNASGVNSIKTETLQSDGVTYGISYTIMDSLLRGRQTQSQSKDGIGRVIVDQRYDSRGLVVDAPTYIGTGEPAATLVEPADRSKVPTETITAYDAVARPVTSILKSYDTEQFRTVTSYTGDTVTVTPPTGGTPTTTSTDVRGRTTAITQWLGTSAGGSTPQSKTSYSYNPAGQLAKVTDPKNNTWLYSYDLQGNKIKTVDPDKGTTTATYDLIGNQLTGTDARGKGVATSYDNLYRPVKTTDLTGATTFTTTVWDTLKPGLQTSSSRTVNGAQITNQVNSYDTAGRATSTSVIVPAITGIIPTQLAGTYTTTNSYNPDGSINTIGLPATGPVPAETLTTTYTNRNLPFSLVGTTTSGSYSYEYETSYTQLGEPSLLSPSSAAHYNVYLISYESATRRPNQFQTQNETSVTERTYLTYNNAGQITKNLTQPATGTADTQCYTYDYQQQLTAAWTPTSGDCTTTPTQAGLGGPAPYWTTWTTDTIGKTSSRTDRTPTTNTTTNFVYNTNGSNQPHAITSTTGTNGTKTYSYDPAGNTTSRPNGATTQTLSWNDEGKLASITNGATTLQTNLYDPNGNRILRAENGRTTLYVAGTDLTYTTTTNTVTATRYYTFAGRTIATRTGNTDATITTLLTDYQNTTHQQTNPTTGTTTTQWLAPYGQTRNTPTGWTGEHSYVGGTNDTTTGLIHIGARDYDTTLNHFITTDPLLQPDNPLNYNPYTYTDNNPTNRSDPTGLYGPEDGYADPAAGLSGDTGSPYYVYVPPKPKVSTSTTTTNTNTTPAAKPPAPTKGPGAPRSVPATTTGSSYLDAMLAGNPDRFKSPGCLNDLYHYGCAQVDYGPLGAELLPRLPADADPLTRLLAILSLLPPGLAFRGGEGAPAGAAAKEILGEAAAANAGARTFGNFAANDLRAAAQAADRNGLTQVGRALQKHSGREGSVFNGLSNGSATARNEQGLRVLDDILNDPGGRTEVLDRVTNIWDSTGRGVRYGNDGSFMGFLEPVG